MENEIIVSGQLGIKDENHSSDQKPPQETPNYTVRQQEDLPNMGESQLAGFVILGLICLALILLLKYLQKLRASHLKHCV
ncbi:hypothetical protein [Pseudolactococcus reticulitermitis]|uniref:Uncharacterized protein n=1 Tax=Pseudolactococcus reticulitermitis TaxID=2025039 RepID=A0A224X9X8_9LACT|nr:hypothetical protein [Lactococcus reticulitermitis]GAX46501.1 hypothetical protein RsY01_80 [Lactococcus reticulitermitis]